MAKTPEKIFQDKIDFLLKAEKRLDKAVAAHQRKLFDILILEYLPLFEVEDGIVLSSAKNDALLSKIDSLFDKLLNTMYKDVIGPFAADLLKSAEISAQYYVGLGFEKKVITKLLRTKVRLEKKLGITPKGRLRKDGYLFKLGQTPQVRQELLNYVLTNLTGDVSFLDFQLGMRNLVIGNKRQKALATTGRLQRYFDQYAYDAFSQMDSVANSQLAANLNLDHFIYQGSLIDTSRPFCEKRAGRAFTVKETKKWKNDSNLIDKKNKAGYRPLIERGRYRCRHFIRYITKELYLDFKNRGLAGLKAA